MSFADPPRPRFKRAYAVAIQVGMKRRIRFGKRLPDLATLLFQGLRYRVHELAVIG